MKAWVLRVSIGAALLCAALPVARTPVAASRNELSLAATRVLLPDGLQPPILESGRRVVSMIAADLDADGDLDVVTNDESLALTVWINDGSGHLTPRPPARRSGWQTEPPLSSIHQRQIGSLASVQNETTVVVPDVRAGPVLTRPDLVPDDRRPLPTDSFASTRRPRGPPASM